MSYNILACGSNGNYQLGTGDDNDYDTLTNIPITLSSRPVQFAFGGNHTLLRLEDGHVYVCGNNQYGQCGIADVETVRKFTQIPGKWAKIAAGWEFSVLVSESGSIFTCGHGPKGELGIGAGITKSLTIRKVLLPPELANCVVNDIKASIGHVLVQCTNGRYFGWGNCRKGQLGPPEFQKTARGNKPIGLYWTPRGVDVEGSLFCVGRDRSIFSGSKGITIIGKDPQFIACTPLKVQAMWSSVHYGLDVDGRVGIFSQGNNLHGQLFNFAIPGELEDFEVGSEHGIVRLQDNSVYAWGWGEHGNCGRKQSDSVTFDYLNQIYSGTHQVELMACGLATTWIVERREVEMK